MRSLSTAERDVQRSFEKAIVDRLVLEGYCPDRTTYANDKVGYKAAQSQILSTKGFCVEVYGHGAPFARGELSVPRITITGQGFYQGGTGAEFGDSFELNSDNETYSKFSQGNPLSNYRIKVQLDSNSTVQDRFIESIRQAQLPNLAYIPKWDDPNILYLITYTFTGAIPELTHGLICKIYTYEIHDIQETRLNLISDNISPIKKIVVYDDPDDTETPDVDGLEIVVEVPKPYPVALTTPIVGGVTQVGNTLQLTSPGTYSGDDVVLTYQWLRDDAIISGQTNSTYDLVIADKNTKITLRETATNDFGSADQLVDKIIGNNNPPILTSKVPWFNITDIGQVARNGNTYIDPEGGNVTPSMEGTHAELFTFNVINGQTCNIVLTLNGELAPDPYHLTLVLTDSQGARSKYPVLVEVFPTGLTWPAIESNHSLVATFSPRKITLSGSGWTQPDRPMNCFLSITDVLPLSDNDPVSACSILGYFLQINGNNLHFGPGGILEIYTAWAAQYNPANFQTGKKVYLKVTWEDNSTQGPSTYFEAQIV